MLGCLWQAGLKVDSFFYFQFSSSEIGFLAQDFLIWQLQCELSVYEIHVLATLLLIIIFFIGIFLPNSYYLHYFRRYTFQDRHCLHMY